MQAFTGVGVAAVGFDHEHVVFGQAFQGDTGGLVVTRDVDGVAVEHGTMDPVGCQVDVGIRARQGLELTVVVDRNSFSRS